MNDDSVLTLLRKATAFFQEQGVSEAKRSAEHLLAHALECKRLQLYLRFDQPVHEDELHRFRALVRRRLANEPVQYIVGTTEFYGMEFDVSPAALIPRPETEHLVEAVVDWWKAGERISSPSLLDIGTGSGCIAIALAAQLPGAHLTAVDISDEALALARRNAERHALTNRIDFLQLDIIKGGFGDMPRFDIIVSNPPYISTSDMAALQAEIRLHEPAIALTDGNDGLLFFRRIADHAKSLLRPGGLLGVEIGFGQSESVQRILTTSGFDVLHVISDYAAIERVILATLNISVQ
jgi:release factor glutamine methyltransferase